MVKTFLGACIVLLTAACAQHPQCAPCAATAQPVVVARVIQPAAEPSAVTRVDHRRCRLNIPIHVDGASSYEEAQRINGQVYQGICTGTLPNAGRLEFGDVVATWPAN